MKKEEYKFVGRIILAIAVLFPIVTIILTTSVNTTLPIIGNIYSFFSGIEKTSDWIGFWGNYFGGVSSGIITVAVFYWTIKNSEKTRKEDQRLQIIPVLDYDILNISCKKYKSDIKEKMNDKNFVTCEVGDYCFVLDITLQVHNIGLGPAQKVILNSCQYGEKEDIGKEKIGTIPDKGKKIIHKKLSMLDNYDHEIGWSKTITWEFNFVDMFGHQYEQKFDTEIWYLFRKEDEKDEWKCSINNQNPAVLKE